MIGLCVGASLFRHQRVRGETAVKLSTRRRRWGLAALVAAVCAVVGVSQATSSPSANITLTEEDYFNTPGQIAALGRLQQAIRGRAPRREDQAAVRAVRQPEHEAADAGRRPRPAEPAGRRQPVRLDHDLDGPGRPGERAEGLQQEGLLPGGDQRGLRQRQVLQPACGRRQLDRPDLQHRDAQGGARHSAEDVGAAGSRRQGADDLGPLRDRADL